MKNKLLKITAGVLGVIMIATSAFAGAVNSGYEGLKDSAKKTAIFLTGSALSFTVSSQFGVELDGVSVSKNDIVQKVDVSRNARELVESLYKNGEQVREYYSYDDGSMFVRTGLDKKYYVRNYENGSDKFRAPVVSNPFDEQVVQDLEKVVDALGSQYGYLIQKEKSGDSRRFVVGLENGNIPVFVNAVMSFVLKQGRSYADVSVSKDVFVESIDGVYETDEGGILKSARGRVVFSFKDSYDTPHNLEVSLDVSVSGIDTTEIASPDLDGKDVEVVSDYEDDESRVFDSHYVGVYKSDMVERDETGFSKIGEVVLEIVSISDDGTITGNISAPFVLGGSSDFSVVSESGDYAEIAYINSDGNERVAILSVPYLNAGYIEMCFDFSKVQESLTRKDSSETYRYVLNRVF